MSVCIRIGDQILSTERPLIMGILNLTKDSFYDGGKYLQLEKAIAQFEKMLVEGADIIDVGAFSSRPGAKDVPVEEQLSLLKPFLEEVKNSYPQVPISIDCNKAEIVRTLCKIKPFLVNDISGFGHDPELLLAVAERGLPYVLMHIRGNPENMQSKASYEDVCFETLTELAKKVHTLRATGIHDFILDPGFGFSKTTGQNFELLANLETFRLFERPLMVGISRKSMIYKTLGVKPQAALNGTTALHMTALMNGADILRVHDVTEASETRNLWVQLQSAVKH